MSEILFPYRPILEELTSVVNEQGLDPFEAYGWLYQKQADLHLHPSDYLSTSITSGGHARDDSLEMREVIIRNTNSATLLANQLAADRQITPEGAIEPVFVGKTHWDQTEFMEFWLSVIAGIELKNGFVARDVDAMRSDFRGAYEIVGLDLSVMRSKVGPELRAPEYFRMAKAFSNVITTGKEAHPVQRVVRMIDTDMSLGSQTERIFARAIGSSVMNITVVQPVSPSELQKVNHHLAADTARLIKFGATIFDTSSKRVRLMLTEAA